MKVLVTGASGFVGAEVVRALADAGHHPVAALRSASNAWRLPSGTERVSLDLEEEQSLSTALESVRPEAIIHSAAYGAVSTEREPIRMVNVNVRGSVALHLSAAAAGVRRFVHVGSAVEYGTSHEALDEEAPLRPRGMYAATKTAAYLAVSEHGKSHGPRPVTLRLFNLFGPNDDPSRLAAQVARGARARVEIDLTAGDQKRDFSFVRDTARRIVAVATLHDNHYPAGGTFNVASGKPIAVREFASSLAEELGARDLLRFGKIADRSDAPTDMFASVTRLMNLLAGAGRSDALALTPFDEAARACLGDEN